MKKILLFLLLPITNLYAQDSLYYQKDGYTNYFETILDINNQNPTNYYSVEVKNFTSSNVLIGLGNHKINLKNQAGKSFDIRLSANGIYRLNKSIFTGGISYKKQYPKEIGWNLSQMIETSELEKSPFYYYAYQAGKWNNQLYQLKGQFTTPLLADRLYMTLDVDYNTNQYYRTDDPKPELTYLDLLSTFSLNYKLSAKHQVGFSLFWGYMNNEIDIEYTSVDLNVPHYANLYNRISLGYGLSSSAKLRKGKEDKDKLGGALHYSYKNNNSLVNLTLRFLKSKNEFKEVATSTDYDIGNYKLSTYAFHASYYNKVNKKYALLKIRYRKGDNYRYASAGKNYEASSILANAELGFLKEKEGKVNYELALFSDFNYLKKKDFIVLNSIEYSNVKVGEKFTKTFHLNKNRKIWWKNELAYQFKVSEKSSFADATDKFVKDIAMPELRYNTSSQITFNNKIAYQSVIKNFKFNLGLFANTNMFVDLGKDAEMYFGNTKGINRYVGVFFNLLY